MKPAILLCMAGFAWGLPASNASARLDISYLENFTATGEFEDCINTRFIKESKILDNSTIVFVMRSREYYVNRLPHRCSGLRVEDGFAYDLRGTHMLCKVDTISVYAPCPLGRFERLVRRTATPPVRSTAAH